MTNVLTQSDKAILLSWGYRSEDIDQIEFAITRYMKYEDGNNKPISRKTAISLIGRTQWLSGCSRAAFHWTCGRDNNGNYVHFNASKMFQ